MNRFEDDDQGFYLSVGFFVGGLMWGLVVLVVYAVKKNLELLPTLQTIGSLAVALSAIIAFSVFRANSNKAISDDRKRISLDYLEESKLLLERAYSTITSAGTHTDIPLNDRLVWLTTARFIESYKKMKSKISEKDHEGIIEEHEEFWRHQFYLLLNKSELGFPLTYFVKSKQSAEWDFENLAPVSLAVVYAFSDWPEGKVDILENVDTPKELAKGTLLVKHRGLSSYIEKFKKHQKEIDKINQQKTS